MYMKIFAFLSLINTAFKHAIVHENGKEISQVKTNIRLVFLLKIRVKNYPFKLIFYPLMFIL